MAIKTNNKTGLRNGFYIKVGNKSSINGTIIRRDNQVQLLAAITIYEKCKDIQVLGEFRNGEWIEIKGV